MLVLGAPPQPSSCHIPSPYQVPVAACEGAGHLPGAGSPGWGCQVLPGCKVGRYGHHIWGESVRKAWLRCCAGPLRPPQGRNSAPNWEFSLLWGDP